MQSGFGRRGRREQCGEHLEASTGLLQLIHVQREPVVVVRVAPAFAGGVDGSRDVRLVVHPPGDDLGWNEEVGLRGRCLRCGGEGGRYRGGEFADLPIDGLDGFRLPVGSDDDVEVGR